MPTPKELARQNIDKLLTVRTGKKTWIRSYFCGTSPHGVRACKVRQ